MIELFFGLAALILAIGLLRWLHVTFPRSSRAVWTAILFVIVIGGAYVLKQGGH